MKIPRRREERITLLLVSVPHPNAKPSVGPRGRWEWGFALFLDRQTRIDNTNKINYLYVIDFADYFISI